MDVFEVSDDAAEERGFAGSDFSDDAEKLPSPDIEIDGLECGLEGLWLIWLSGNIERLFDFAQLKLFVLLLRCSFFFWHFLICNDFWPRQLCQLAANHI